MIQGHGDDLYRYGNRVEINFSTNIFNHFDHSPLFDFLARKLHLITSYPEPEPTTLEQAIARQNGVSPDSIMVTNGATEAIYLMAQCFADRVSFIVQPTFAEYADACRMHGNTPPTDITTPTSADTLGSNTALWLCNPNNPTGNVVPHNELLDTIARNPHTLFIIDQSYARYTLKPTLTPSEAAEADNVLLLNSMTKDYGIPGLRLGYVTASEKLIDMLRRYRMPWAVNSLAISAGLFLINHRSLYTINTEALCQECVRVSTLIQKLGIATCPSDSNMLLCRLPEHTAAELKEFLVDHYGILIRDASNFHTLSPQHFRIAVQTTAENDTLIKALTEWTKQ